jgi:formate dehydrogenase iron-sulfur subunit
MPWKSRHQPRQCRIGWCGVEVIDRLVAAGDADSNRASRCCMIRTPCCTVAARYGGMTPFPVLSALEKFPEDFGLSRHEAVPQ